MKNRLSLIGRILLTWGIAFCVMYLFSSLFASKIFPSPFEILRNILYNKTNELFYHAYVSGLRLFKAIGISLIVSVPISLVMGTVPAINKVLSPAFYFSYPIPKLALLPIVMLLFGLGEWTKVIMMIIIIFFPMTVQIRDSVRSLDESLYEPYISIGMKPIHRMTFITLKGVIPALLSSVRIGIGTALSVLFFAENFGTTYGIGYYIMDAWMRINYVDMYSGIIIISLIGVLLFTILDRVERRFCSWMNISSVE